MALSRFNLSQVRSLRSSLWKTFHGFCITFWRRRRRLRTWGDRSVGPEWH